MMCLLCRSHNVRLLLKPSASLSKTLQGQYFISSERFGLHDAIYQCAACSFAFIPRLLVDKHALDAFYENAPLDIQYLRDSFGRKKTARRILGAIDSFAPPINPHKRILDIGCNAGLFLREAELAGFEGYGVDLSRNAVLFAQKHCGLRSVVRGGGNAIAQFPDNFFSVITAFDVLEHVYDPFSVAALVDRKLRKNGLFVFTAPLLDSPSAKIMGPYWHGFLPSHLSYFTRDAIARFIARNGWQLVMARYYLRFFSLASIIRRMVQKNDLWLPSFFNITVGAHAFDEIEVYARKQKS
ncbi:hypothetical protein A3J56_03415 [Candidatus Giovannonibacteria bacterium RIFCSPHIGHO2_02_FULL_46_20]|uniref:Methyltransferase type 11 domain-containing protein n=1 Tax=Candidatus Giovannonibacteria bacterium RIFCSPHIGHO2_02_FULL_46_20 TaxID=1798338 RepID=A0A1F5WG81_9BACT|nr:MAG: hypothetical protein A3J56_03415 [Candidatus Giovannonibacteria bacterium RIFCSPHIGHO2_02_FULL_46_20]